MPAEEANARGVRTLFTVRPISLFFPAYHNLNIDPQIFAHASQNTKCSLFTPAYTLAEESKTRKERETEKRQAAIISELRRELNTAKAALNPKRTSITFPCHHH
jgi:hypothetical protein